MKKEIIYSSLITKESYDKFNCRFLPLEPGKKELVEVMLNKDGTESLMGIVKIHNSQI